MRQRAMRCIAGVLAFLLIAAMVPVQEIYAAPKKLSLKDFNYFYGGGESGSFLDTDKVSVILGKDIKTYRGIRVGSKLSAVKKKYGNSGKKKYDAKESFNRYYKEYGFQYTGGDKDDSKWKNYVEYVYKKNGKNDRRLRFYLDKNDKVAAIIYIDKYKNYKLSKRSVKDIGLTFQAPEGKKITTKTINGKRVQVLPARTKMVYEQSKLPEFGILAYVHMYDTKNRRCGENIMPINLNWSEYNGMEIKDVLKDMNVMNFSTGNSKRINFKKLGKYNYFEIVISDMDYNGGFDRPLRYYFRLA